MSEKAYLFKDENAKAFKTAITRQGEIILYTEKLTFEDLERFKERGIKILVRDVPEGTTVFLDTDKPWSEPSGCAEKCSRPQADAVRRVLCSWRATHGLCPCP